MRSVNADGSPPFITTLAGSGSFFGAEDGTARAALFGVFSNANAFGAMGLGQVSLDAGGNVWVADSSNSRIRVLTPAGVVTTIVGGYTSTVATTGVGGFVDGEASTALLNSPRGVIVNGSGVAYGSEPYVVFIADSGAWRGCSSI